MLISSPVGGNDTELKHTEAAFHTRSHIVEQVVEKLTEKQLLVKGRD